MMKRDGWEADGLRGDEDSGECREGNEKRVSQWKIWDLKGRWR